MLHFVTPNLTLCSLLSVYRINVLCAIVDGGWSEWSSWSECSSSCGRGVSVRHRTCTQPTPTVGARFCQGNAVDTRPCQTSCPSYSNGIH